MSRFLSNLWKRKDYLDKRTRHQDIDDICGGLSSGGFTMSGIYLIGCGDRIVYIGQSIGTGGIAHRSIESLARIYPQVEDETLPWSIGLAPYKEYRAPFFYEDGEDFNELESTAIRKYAPMFNTSIPSKLKSQGKELEIKHIAEVFADVDYPCTAFESDNLDKQVIEAENNQSPPWQQGNKRRRKWNPNTNQYELLEKYIEE
jgi:hypothetical protein